MDLYYFKRSHMMRTHVSSCRLKSLLRHVYLSAYIYIFLNYLKVLIVFFFFFLFFFFFFLFFVSVNVTSVNILINNITTFICVSKKLLRKIWSLFIFTRLNLQPPFLGITIFCLLKAHMGPSLHPMNLQHRIVIISCIINSVVSNVFLLHL